MLTTFESRLPTTILIVVDQTRSDLEYHRPLLRTLPCPGSEAEWWSSEQARALVSSSEPTCPLPPLGCDCECSLKPHSGTFQSPPSASTATQSFTSSQQLRQHSPCLHHRLIADHWRTSHDSTPTGVRLPAASLAANPPAYDTPISDAIAP